MFIITIVSFHTRCCSFRRTFTQTCTPGPPHAHTHTSTEGGHRGQEVKRLSRILLLHV